MVSRNYQRNRDAPNEFNYHAGAASRNFRDRRQPQELAKDFATLSLY
jgi:hypothetical protein